MGVDEGNIEIFKSWMHNVEIIMEKLSNIYSPKPVAPVAQRYLVTI